MGPESKIKKTTYKISKMDCPAEEQIIRLNLETIDGIRQLDFDLQNRILTVFHVRNDELISERIDKLDLDSRVLASVEALEIDLGIPEISGQVKILWIVLVINFGFFLIEMVSGIISRSMGLVADSLDMFADAAVYGMGLLAVGKAIAKQKLVARYAGYFQFLLAVLGFVEVIRRFIGFEKMPDFLTMIIVSVFALIGNALSLYLLQRSKSKEAHMQASMIFTSNDIVVNGGVIVAGVLVSLLNSKIPDLLIGAIVFLLVIRGSLRILKLAK